MTALGSRMRTIWLVLLMIALSGCCPWCGRKEYNEAKAKMAELCAKDGGNTVFSTVQLAPGEKFTEEGYPPMYRHFESENALGQDYLVNYHSEDLFQFNDGMIKGYKATILILKKKNGHVLGQTIVYGLVDKYAVEGTGSGHTYSCPEEGLNTQKLYKQIFIQSD